MDAPVKELQRIDSLQREGRLALEAGRAEEALAAAEAALELEPRNTRSLTLKADALEAMGRGPAAQQLRVLIRQIKREAWERQVEAELRGRHDLLGEAIRHEQL